MNNTHLRLNVFYKVVPMDRGFYYDGPTKTTDPLIPDDVIMSLFAMRTQAELDYSGFSMEYAQYRSIGECYVGIPCPNIEGYLFSFIFSDGKVASWKVSVNQ